MIKATNGDFMKDFASSFTKDVESVINELSQVLHQLDMIMVEAFCDTLWTADSVFLAGAGRSGLVVRAFAMRLMHLGVKTRLVGDILTPPIGKGDLLVAASGSGETGSIVTIAGRARDSGACLGLITAHPTSTLGKMADTAVVLSAPTPKARDQGGGAESCQPMGSLFEQSAFLFFETVVLELMRRSGQNSGMMFLRHANLE